MTGERGDGRNAKIPRWHEIPRVARKFPFHFRKACCLIEKDTEADAYGAEYQFHCLIIEDTVANVRRNE